jgi:hypothetical protein
MYQEKDPLRNNRSDDGESLLINLIQEEAKVPTVLTCARASLMNAGKLQLLPQSTVPYNYS